MSNLPSLSSMATILHTSDIICQSVCLTDEVKINLQYDIHRGLLNIFVKNIGENCQLPCHINVLSDRSDIIQSSSNHHLNSPQIESDSPELICDVEPKICYEISTTYSYDLIYDDENLHEIDLNETMIISSSSSCSDVQTFDNDDGYSTHSHDDTDPPVVAQQQLSLMIPPVQSLHPSFYFSSEQYVLSVRRLIKQLIWFNPFKKTIEQMMMNQIFA